ncbi:septum formation family protein [Streptomyces pristinaespiralis]|uniref:Septum formation-related domain-containing protein n=2 Tax=Streptomyces pristinaespiralis TaxID=38300 RepID=B5H861_STRE2|nr:septum formation family protein [Streptomyces pristinaespiralis]ALC19009.1 hypothetical protein SPRI_0703 [Streptomyces pristinaespiralis]EDY63052.1 conserved hypothetical protein [Streptomyces pristinaespiralis ATCC 25486]
MITRPRLSLAAVAVATSVFLTACSGGSEEQDPAHPVFDATLQQQPRQALLATQAAGTASFRQTLTFTSEHGDSVQTSEGRLDFDGSRAAGSQAWKIADGLPDEAKDALLGTRLGEGRSPARSDLAIDPGTIRLRSGEAAYWLRYDESAPFGSGDSIDALRGTEAAFGGTLLEIVSGAQEVRQSAADGGGRTYRARLTAFNTLRMFSKDLRDELISSIDPGVTERRVTLDLSVDADGRISRAEADFSALLGRKDSALRSVTGLRAVLTVSGFGASPPVMPPLSGRTVSAKDTVRPIGEVEPGACVDLNTGTRVLDMVVAVSCEQPHDARVFAHAAFGADHPGRKAARQQAGENCRQAYRSASESWTREAVKDDMYWYTWPTEAGWNRGGKPVASCYVVSR